MLSGAHSQIRQSFRSTADLGPSGSVQAIEHARDVAKFLRENVVQGKRVDGEQDTFSECRHKLSAKTVLMNRLQSFAFTNTPNEEITSLSRWRVVEQPPEAVGANKDSRSKAHRIT